MKNILKKLNSLIFLTLHAVFVLMISINAYSQEPVVMRAVFNSSEMKLNPKERFVSNTLMVYNPGAEPMKFYIEVISPESWKILSLNTEAYTLEGGDSLVIPLRLIPGIKAKEGMNITIQALLINEDQSLLADASFIIRRKKEVRWEITSETGDRIYFPVNEDSINFAINVQNQGNEKIDLLLSQKQLGNNIQIEDSIKNRKNYHELILQPAEDTSLSYMASINTNSQIHKRVDTENYTPANHYDEFRNTLFFQSQLADGLPGKSFRGSRRMDFIRLSSEKTVNPYGSGTIPLIADANFYNILGIQPVMNLDLRGSTMVSEDGVLSYQSQFMFNNFEYNNELTRNVYYRFAYNDALNEVQVGNISGGLNRIPITGKGISASRFITSDLRTGAYYIRNSLDASRFHTHAYGAYARYQFRKMGTFTMQYGKSKNTDTNREMNFLSASASVKVLKFHQFGASYTTTRTTAYLNVPTNTGNAYSGNYSGSYLQRKLSVNLRGTYFTPGYGHTAGPGYQADHRTGFTPNKKWSLVLQNKYHLYEQYDYITPGSTVKNSVLYNQLFFNVNKKDNRIMPSVFYNITDVNHILLHYRGIGFDYSSSVRNGATRLGLSTRAGYNDLPDYDDIEEYFTLQFASTLQHNAFSFNGRYYYGPQYVSNLSTLNNSLKYPQSLFLSVQQQWVPGQSRFVCQTSANYSYMNQFNHHTIGVYPEVFYFTKSKWRFKMGVGYSVGISKPDRAIQAYQGEFNPVVTEPKTTSTHSFYMNAGIRKEFGIPVPEKWVKQKYADLEFTAFLDADGNGKMDKNEVALSNIIIRLNNEEVITNEEGKAKLIHMNTGKFIFRATSLYPLYDWYPLIEDSMVCLSNMKINIPFIKGIKLSGSITVQKDRYTGLNGQIDLSRILVTARDSAEKEYTAVTDKNGEYVLFLPPGKYTLSMDEAFLGSSFITLKNHAEIDLQEVETFNYNFYILEKKRKVNIKKF